MKIADACIGLRMESRVAVATSISTAIYWQAPCTVCSPDSFRSAAARCFILGTVRREETRALAVARRVEPARVHRVKWFTDARFVGGK